MQAALERRASKMRSGFDVGLNFARMNIGRSAASIAHEGMGKLSQPPAYTRTQLDRMEKNRQVMEHYFNSLNLPLM